MSELPLVNELEPTPTQKAASVLSKLSAPAGEGGVPNSRVFKEIERRWSDNSVQKMTASSGQLSRSDPAFGVDQPLKALFAGDHYNESKFAIRVRGASEETRNDLWVFTSSEMLLAPSIYTAMAMRVVLGQRHAIVFCMEAKASSAVLQWTMERNARRFTLLRHEAKLKGPAGSPYGMRCMYAWTFEA